MGALAAHIGKGMRAAEGAILKTLSPQLSRQFLGSLSSERGLKFVCCFSGLVGRSGEI